MNVMNDLSAEALRIRITQHLTYTLGKDKPHASLYDWRMAVSFSVRDLIIEPWFAATRKTYEAQGKRVYYLSLEFLIGRILGDAMMNLGLFETVKDVLDGEGVSLADVIEDEPDAALGNGGLGRLAACFLESLPCIWLLHPL
jgi:starch phosphorylase